MVKFYLKRCMRITTLIIGIQTCCVALALASGTKAQSITLNVQKAPVTEVFRKPEREAVVTFPYNAQGAKT
ncbi:MAG: hypothetical protein JSU01_00020, partial [Bacteroidetes bacterium]|nr:hypothetical protein [Bacteroidota bacterium]